MLPGMNVQQTPTPEHAAAEGPVLTFDAWCNSCGYNLAGLPTAGLCPECGAPVEQSLKGDLLENASPAHVETLRKGVSLVLNGLLVSVVVNVLAIPVGIVMMQYGAYWPTHLMNMVGLLVSGVILWGWWMFSKLDPAYTGRHDASKSRAWLRILLFVHVGFSLAGLLLAYVAAGQEVETTVDVLALAVWAAKFFLEMSYVRWLAPRLPNERVAKRAKLLMWLGPVLYSAKWSLWFAPLPFALLAVFFGLGPLIALIFYWNLLNWVRNDLKAIQERQTLEALAAAARAEIAANQ
jgi:hypothetical protein